MDEQDIEDFNEDIKKVDKIEGRNKYLLFLILIIDIMEISGVLAHVYKD